MFYYSVLCETDSYLVGSNGSIYEA